MSGICGFADHAGAPASAEVLRRMVESAVHRGSGGWRELIVDRVGLARLEHSGSPERVASDPSPRSGSRLYLTADARLDNRAELMELLEGDWEDTPPADEELILAAYRRWGASFPEHLLGDFALALWDVGQQRLLCVRDPLGIKPLHYARWGSLVCFASQAQQVLQHPALPRRLDEVTVGSFLCGAPLDAERTLFRDVRAVPPAHCLVSTPQGIELKRYWDVDPGRRIVYRRDEEYASAFHELFDRAVADRLRVTEGSVGIAMSGGLDSCSVAAVARRHLRDRRPVAGSFVFGELPSCDERSYIRTMADETGLDLIEIEADRFWVFKDPGVDRPSPGSLVMSCESAFEEMLARLQAKGVRVLLTGNGGDEVAGGSGRCYADRLRRGDLRALADAVSHARRRGVRLRRLLYHCVVGPLLPPAADRVLRRLSGRADFSVPAWISPQLLRRTDLPAYWRAQRPARRFDDHARQAIYEKTTGGAGYGPAIDWYDRLGSRLGIEVRHPFLDVRLVELVVAIPPQQLFQTGTTKPLLRRAMAGRLPERIRQRPDKTNLAPFIDLGLRDREAGAIEELLEKPLSAELGFVDGKKLRAHFRRYRSGGRIDDVRGVFYAVVLEFWLRKYYTSFIHSSAVQNSPIPPP